LTKIDQFLTAKAYYTYYRPGLKDMSKGHARKNLSSKRINPITIKNLRQNGKR